MGITKLVLKRPVSAVLAILCLIVFGISSVFNTTLELTPDMDMSMMVIMTYYSGASPEDVAELVTKPIEDNISALSGLDNITSKSSEGSSMIMLSYDYGTDMDKAYDDLKKKVDQVSRELPDGCKTPSIFEMNMNSGSDMTLMIQNKKESANLYNYVENKLSPEFEKIPEVADIKINGGNKQYISIELNEEKMLQYGVTMSSIAGDISAADATIPAGSTLDGSQELSVSTRMKYDSFEALGDIPLTTKNQNDVVYLQDVATVNYANEKNDSIAKYDGEDTITISISRQQSASSMKLSEKVRNTIDTLSKKDNALEITVISDTSENITDSINDVVKTLILAIVISMIIIYLFFGDIKASLIVGSSIPASILAALILMSSMGYSLNMITLSALTLGVGMMVDNSIVVLESCFRVTAKNKEKQGLLEYARDALDGTGIVAMSVIASTITTCVVFLPLGLLSGMTGQMFGPLGFTIVFCMSASLISAITVVPLCYMMYKPEEKTKAMLNDSVKELQDGYRVLMQKILPKKKTVMITSVLLLVGSLLLATTLTIELMPSDDQGEISITVNTRPGTEIKKIEPALDEIEEIIKQDPDLEHYRTEFTGGSGNSEATIAATLKDDRSMETKDVVNKWKKELSDVTNCDISVEMKSSMSMMSSSGDNYEVMIQGADYDEVKEVVNEIVSDIETRDDIARVHSSIDNSSPVVEVTVDAIKAKSYGLTAGTIGSTLRSILTGSTVTSIPVNGEDTDVKVEYPVDQYDSLYEIKNILLSAGNGGQVVLTDVADVHYVDSPASIARADKQYNVTITAEYSDKATKESPKQILEETVKPNLTGTVTIGKSTMDKTRSREMGNLMMALLEAVFLVFVVMASQFESPKYSLMVMTTIPFSLIGSFSLLWLTDCSISMVSMVGFLMLIGTAVNNGILYVDTANQYRGTMDFDEALIEAGATRIRPILMTTLTTVISMIPMAMAFGNAGSMNQGLAIVNIGGLTASTLLCLLMLPVYYSVMTPKHERNAFCGRSEGPGM
ncbi:efflux RND transporter permease subunit [Oribacterium sp. WCC10]|uniref:efflux RND transporter permease subunit n=1 Tax=Oribacterium sp. WCC10 TaxID=1855343 RepID=UPI0008E0CD76|nr:efflux RND transporter permease subunit [Oribacterium sp. WCC10]SFG45330.1 hydrophobic/amphiphilic exporter-1, HAE1 family [Oribacterium sp. WCC10]